MGMVNANEIIYRSLLNITMSYFNQYQAYQCENERPDWVLRVPNFDGDDTKYEHSDYTRNI